jgi:hypothetical protein
MSDKMPGPGDFTALARDGPDRSTDHVEARRRHSGRGVTSIGTPLLGLDSLEEGRVTCSPEFHSRSRKETERVFWRKMKEPTRSQSTCIAAPS